MKTIVALFKGINVGGKNILPMKALKCLLEENACMNVKSYIQSGNVIFDCDEIPENLSSLIKEKFSFKPEILFLSRTQFLEIAKGNPFTSTLGKTIHFYFCIGSLSPDIQKIKTLKADNEQYHIKGQVLYLHAPDGIGRSKLVANIEKCMGTPATGRNLNTVKNLMAMLEV